MTEIAPRRRIPSHPAAAVDPDDPDAADLLADDPDDPPAPADDLGAAGTPGDPAGADDASGPVEPGAGRARARTDTSPAAGPGRAAHPARSLRASRTWAAVGRTRSRVTDWLDRPMTSWHLILAVFVLLLGFGLLMVLSASAITSYRGRTGSAFSTFNNQAVFALLGSVLFVVAARVSPRLIRRFSFAAVLASLLLLAAVLAVGQRKNGARSWLGFGPVSFQPSEVAKIALLLWMAHVLAARRHELRSLKALLIPALPIFLAMVGLIMLQPDLGTTVSLAIVFFAVLWFGGAPLWIFGGLVTAGVAGVGYLAISQPYRLTRMLAFLHPDDPAYSAATYQLKQALFGMGDGGVFGVGLGRSIAKWSWLPNADSDFIFAIIGEELGLIGAGLVLVLFGLLAYTGLRISRRNVDPFIKIVAASCTVWLVGQAAINIGYVVGLLPVTGIPLPMISQGGTSLVVSMIVFGLLANFARREPQAAAALYSQGPGRLARFLGVHPHSPAGLERARRKQEQRENRRAERQALRVWREREAARDRHPARPAGGRIPAPRDGRAIPGEFGPAGPRPDRRGPEGRTPHPRPARGSGAPMPPADRSGRRSPVPSPRPERGRAHPDRRRGHPGGRPEDGGRTIRP